MVRSCSLFIASVVGHKQLLNLSHSLLFLLVLNAVKGQGSTIKLLQCSRNVSGFEDDKEKL